MNAPNNLIQALYASDSEDDEAAAVLNRIRRGDFNNVEVNFAAAVPPLGVVHDDWEDGGQDYEEEEAPPCYAGARPLKGKGYELPDIFKGNIAVFEGSQHGGKDLGRRLLAFKASHHHLGDYGFAELVGIMATYLPRGNLLQQVLNVQSAPTEYKINGCIKGLAELEESSCRVLEFETCANGCQCFGDNVVCDKCGGCRYKNCTGECFNEANEKVCGHLLKAVRMLYYLPVGDRIKRLLMSDAKRFLEYDMYRYAMIYLLLSLLTLF